MGHVRGKRSPAVVAHVRFLSRVRHDVPAESLFAREPRRTLSTLVRLRIRVDQHVHLVVALRRGLFSAVLADVSLLGSPLLRLVQRDMFLVEGLVGQEFVAGGALEEFSFAGQGLFRIGGFGWAWTCGSWCRRSGDCDLLDDVIRGVGC